MTERKRKRAGVPWGPLAAYFSVLLGVFFIAAWLLYRPVPLLDTAAAVSAFDFSAQPASLSRDLFSFYPNQLYTPQDFASGNTETPVEVSRAEREKTPYATYRLTVTLLKGQIFAVSADSATYAQKVWVGSQLISEVGTVSSDAAGFVAHTVHYTASFTAPGGPVDIVIQRANFVHAGGGNLYEITLGPQEQVLAIADASVYRSVTALGILLTAVLIFFGMGLFFTDRRQYLWFSLACLFLMIRDSFVSPKPVMILIPQLDWALGHHIECCSFMLAFVFMIKFYSEIFPGAVPRWMERLGYVMSLAGAAVYALLPSLVYTRITRAVIYADAAYLVLYVILFVIGMIRQRESYRTTSFELLKIGTVVLLVSGVADAVLYRRTEDYNISQLGMFVYIFLTSTALSLETSRIRTEAEEREAKMKEINRTLSDLYRIRSDFMSDISHEMRTPLTVMSGYAGLTRLQIEKGAVNAETSVHLEIIEKEAVRLSRLVEQMKTVANGRERRLTPQLADVIPALQDAAEFCRPICERRGNRIAVASENGPLMALYVPDSMLQVLYNLIANASRHCESSVIELQAEDAGEMVQISVIDHGTGISPQLLPHVFERGVSGDNSSGLGLALCRDIIADGGGDIFVKSTSSAGTVIAFTLPKQRKEGEEDA
jgi:signal transduction histidine kinase